MGAAQVWFCPQSALKNLVNLPRLRYDAAHLPDSAAAGKTIFRP